MAKYQFKCTNPNCEKCNIEFTAHLPMADVGKTELYPPCDTCNQLTQKVFAPNGAFKLRGLGWMNTPGGYSGCTHDVRGNSLAGSMQIGSAWGDRE